MDEEPELRSIAAQKIHIVSTQIDTEEIISKIMPIVKTLSGDQQSYVRTSLAGSFLHISSLVGKKVTTE